MNYRLIEDRAETIFEILEDKINYGYETNSPDLLDAYKATFGLKAKSISQYCRAFRDSGLSFNISSVEAIYEEYAHCLEGYKGLSFEEKEILRELLYKVKELGANAPFLSP